MAEIQYGIRTKNINKSYDKKQVLFNVSMKVPKGKIYGLLGPSGCGKTTLVKVLVGILKAGSGTAYIGESTLPSLKATSEIGYMSQSAALYPTLTGYENLKFFGSLYCLKGQELEDRIHYVSSLVHLTDDLQKKVGNYSGGMQQRLSLAISLLPNPSVLLLDEPTVGIDPLLRQEIWQELHRLSEKGVTILITTHVMDEAEKCHYLGMMRDGRILVSDTPENILKATGCSSVEDAFILLSAPKQSREKAHEDAYEGGGNDEN
ncbi:MAG: ABC transporter ATP-binding protein [Clostridiales bacterium]|nr:ABC transporter ATP-binding protein [Clostridiales bacterium]